MNKNSVWKRSIDEDVIKGCTHDGVGAGDGGRVAGDPEAAGAGVEAGGVSPVHLAAMQGVVLGGEGQRLALLHSRETEKHPVVYTHRQTQPSLL